MKADTPCIKTQQNPRKPIQAFKFPYKIECNDCNGTGAKNGKTTTCPDCGGAGQIGVRQGFMTIAQTCPRCQGTGERITDICYKCNGKKYKIKEEKLDVEIPVGIDTGNRLRKSGHGNKIGTHRGDLYLSIVVKNDEHFVRDGNDVYIQVPVFFTQAILGDSIKIPGLKGELELKLKPNTKDKEQIIFRHEGIADVHGNGRGDLIAQIEHVYPKKLNREQEELFEKLQKSFGEKSKPSESEFKNVFEKIKGWFE